jgi:hypothetical protein
LALLVHVDQHAAFRGKGLRPLSVGVSCGEDRIEHHPADRIGTRFDLATARSGSAWPRRRGLACTAT